VRALRLALQLVGIIALAGATLQPAVTSPTVTLKGATYTIPVLPRVVSAPAVSLAGTSFTVPRLTREITAPTVTLSGVRERPR
jgi:hypothetical protein